jgi:hypothetical protein
LTQSPTTFIVVVARGDLFHITYETGIGSQSLSRQGDAGLLWFEALQLGKWSASPVADSKASEPLERLAAE